MDHFSTDQAFNLLYVNEENPKLLNLSKEELSFLKLQVIGEWDNITSPYKKTLVTKDKLEFISLCYQGKPLFAIDKA